MTTAGSTFEPILFPADAADNSAPVPTRRKARPRGARLNVNLTSLIDVTFLLLIYFMVATSMTGAEEVYRMDLPNREGVGHADPFELDDQPLIVAVQSTGMGPDAYELTIDGPFPQVTSFDELSDFLSSNMLADGEEAAGNGSRSGQTGLFRRDHPIIVQPTKATRWEHVMEAFNAAARVRYTNVTFGKPG